MASTLATSLNNPSRITPPTPQGPAPGPISSPDQDLPSPGLPGHPVQPSVVSPQTPTSVPNQASGKLSGWGQKLYSKLAGYDVRHEVDPATGKMIDTPVQEKPGELFRNILAAGLMGSEGIGPSHGEHTFAQGLMAGAGAGIKESRDMAEKQDAARRQQAQQNYENQLRANKDKREGQELDQKKILNEAAVANYTVDSVAKKYALAKLMDHDEVLALDNATEMDKTNLAIQQGSGNLPIEVDGKTTLSQEEYQKQVADQNSPVNTRHMVPIHVGHSNDEIPSTDPRYDKTLGGHQYSHSSLIQLYPPTIPLNQGTIDVLIKEGYKSDEPVITDLKGRLAGGATTITPLEYTSLLKKLADETSVAAANLSLVKSRAEIARDNASAAAESQRERDEKLSGDEKQIALNRDHDLSEGAGLLGAIGSDSGYVPRDALGKEIKGAAPISIKVVGPDTYDFSKLTDSQSQHLWSATENSVSAHQAALDKYYGRKQEDMTSEEKADMSAQVKQLSFLRGIETQLKTRHGSIVQNGEKPDTQTQKEEQTPTGPVKIAPNGERVSPGQPTKEPAWDNHAALVRFTNPETGVATYSIQHSAGLYDPKEFEGGIRAWYKRTYGKEPGKDDLKFSGNESGLLLDAPENANWADQSTAEAAEKVQRKANAAPTFAN